MDKITFLMCVYFVVHPLPIQVRIDGVIRGLYLYVFDNYCNQLGNLLAQYFFFRSLTLDKKYILKIVLPNLFLTTETFENGAKIGIY